MSQLTIPNTNCFNNSTQGYGATGVYQAKGVYRASVNPTPLSDFFRIITNPRDAACVSIPDLDSTPHILKTVSFNVNMNINGAAGMFVFPTSSLRRTIRFYGFDSVDNSMNFISEIGPDEDLADNFVRGRQIASGAEIYSSTLASGNFALSGAMNAIYYIIAPDFNNLTPQTLTQYKADNINVVSSVSTAEGVELVSPVYGGKKFEILDTAATPDHSQLLRVKYQNTLPNQVLTNSAAWNTIWQWSVQGGGLPTPLPWGHWRMSLTGTAQLVGWASTANSTPSVRVRVQTRTANPATYARVNTDTTYVYFPDWTTWPIVPAGTPGGSTTSTVARASVNIQIDDYTLAEIGDIFVEVSSNTSGTGTIGWFTQPVDIAIYFDDYYRFGIKEPGCIASFQGVTSGQAFVISGKQHWELVPDTELTKNVPSLYNIDDPMKLDAAMTMLISNFGDPYRFVYSRFMFNALEAAGAFRCSEEVACHRAASIGARFKALAQSLFHNLPKIGAGIGALFDSPGAGMAIGQTVQGLGKSFAPSYFSSSTKLLEYRGASVKKDEEPCYRASSETYSASSIDPLVNLVAQLKKNEEEVENSVSITVKSVQDIPFYQKAVHATVDGAVKEVMALHDRGINATITVEVPVKGAEVVAPRQDDKELPPGQRKVMKRATKKDLFTVKATEPVMERLKNLSQSQAPKTKKKEYRSSSGGGGLSKLAQHLAARKGKAPTVVNDAPAANVGIPIATVKRHTDPYVSEKKEFLLTKNPTRLKAKLRAMGPLSPGGGDELKWLKAMMPLVTPDDDIVLTHVVISEAPIIDTSHQYTYSHMAVGKEGNKVGWFVENAIKPEFVTDDGPLGDTTFLNVLGFKAFYLTIIPDKGQALPISGNSWELAAAVSLWCIPASGLFSGAITPGAAITEIATKVYGASSIDKLLFLYSPHPGQLKEVVDMLDGEDIAVYDTSELFIGVRKPVALYAMQPNLANLFYAASMFSDVGASLEKVTGTVSEERQQAREVQARVRAIVSYDYKPGDGTVVDLAKGDFTAEFVEDAIDEIIQTKDGQGRTYFEANKDGNFILTKIGDAVGTEGWYKGVVKLNSAWDWVRSQKAKGKVKPGKKGGGPIKGSAAKQSFATRLLKRNQQISDQDTSN